MLSNIIIFGKCQNYCCKLTELVHLCIQHLRNELEDDIKLLEGPAIITERKKNFNSLAKRPTNK